MKRRLAIGLVALLAATAAFGAKYGSQRDPDTDFASKETFEFAERSDKKLPAPGSELDTKIRRLVTQELLKKGVRPARDDESADFVLDYEGFLGLEGTMPQDDRSKTRWIYFSEAPGGDAPSVPREQGYVIVQLRDPASDEVLWAGWGSSKVNNQDKLISKIDRMIRRIVGYYPSR